MRFQIKQRLRHDILINQNEDERKRILNKQINQELIEILELKSDITLSKICEYSVFTIGTVKEALNNLVKVGLVRERIKPGNVMSPRVYDLTKMGKERK